MRRFERTWTIERAVIMGQGTCIYIGTYCGLCQTSMHNKKRQEDKEQRWLRVRRCNITWYAVVSSFPCFGSWQPIRASRKFLKKWNGQIERFTHRLLFMIVVLF